MKLVSRIVLMLISVSVWALGAQALPLQEKEWTFLLFINGHNNLSSYGTMNIKDMEKAGSTDQVNLVVEWGQSNDSRNHRLLVEKSTDPLRVTSPILMSVENRDMGDYKNLVDFVKWGVDNFPARHYFVAVWNHGTGWNFQEMRTRGAHYEDISFDDNTGNKITTEELGLAMSEIKQYIGRNVDIYGSDACLMQMMEVASEMKDSVNYIVGSEDLEPGEGWPYAPFMTKWTQNPQIAPADLAVLLSKEYLASYSGGVYGNKSVTFSALDISKLDAALASTSRLVQQLSVMRDEDMREVKRAVGSVQSYYWGTNFRDYGHFLTTIEALPVQKDMATFAQAKADLAALVLTTDNSPRFAKSTGISVWIPTSESSDLPRYKGLVFDRLTGWSQFLERLSGKPAPAPQPPTPQPPVTQPPAPQPQPPVVQPPAQPPVQPAPPQQPVAPPQQPVAPPQQPPVPQPPVAQPPAQQPPVAQPPAQQPVPLPAPSFP